MTTIISRIGTRANFGVPKWNGPVNPTQSASFTEPNLATLPPEPSLTNAAASVPTTRPASTATVARNPRANRVSKRITKMVNPASARLV